MQSSTGTSLHSSEHASIWNWKGQIEKFRNLGTITPDYNLNLVEKFVNILLTRRRQLGAMGKGKFKDEFCHATLDWIALIVKSNKTDPVRKNYFGSNENL